MSATLLPASSHRRVPWKNGGGYTTELVVRPDDDATGSAQGPFTWRLSIATVDRDGGFSAFPGVDRSLMALSPGGLGLVDGGHPVALGRYGVHRFAGENDVAATGVTVPTLDLNLMTRRDACTGVLEHLRLDAPAGTPRELAAPPGGAVVVVLLAGTLHVDDQLLKPHDAVLIERTGQADDGALRLSGAADVAVASVYPLPGEGFTRTVS
ncbi:HutD family protein [Arthrobacter sp. 260]|uniref:HutD/Ves family protein n=1 Tax=Arthrobacter sp. 260 TaxID=2735314 RepID=UPI001492B2FA|nr:HutD family protein [Arthrobacter sp. 260]NOJ60418.1 HutD family protein [Arthrobacter sp. 260]